MHKHLWSYVLTALIAVCLVGLLAMALAPVASAFTQMGKTVGSALAGSK